MRVAVSGGLDKRLTGRVGLYRAVFEGAGQRALVHHGDQLTGVVMPPGGAGTMATAAPQSNTDRVLRMTTLPDSVRGNPTHPSSEMIWHRYRLVYRVSQMR